MHNRLNEQNVSYYIKKTSILVNITYHIILVTLETANLPSLSKEGTVLVTGAGDVGQLGLGPDVLEKSRPTLVPLKYEVVDVCAGGMHTVCLTKDGQVCNNLIVMLCVNYLF